MVIYHLIENAFLVNIHANHVQDQQQHAHHVKKEHTFTSTSVWKNVQVVAWQTEKIVWNVNIHVQNASIQQLCAQHVQKDSFYLVKNALMNVQMDSLELIANVKSVQKDVKLVLHYQPHVHHVMKGIIYITKDAPVYAHQVPQLLITYAKNAKLRDAQNVMVI